MDSAAVDTVDPPAVGKHIPLQQNEISKKGIKFRAANGTPIAFHGEKNLNGVRNDWSTIGMKAQIAEVNKVLASVFQMCKAGHKVVFDVDERKPTQGGFIDHKRSGARTNMEVNQVTGEFQFNLWLTPHFRNIC